MASHAEVPGRPSIESALAKLNTSPGTSPGHSPRASFDHTSLLNQFSTAAPPDISLPLAAGKTEASGAKQRPQPSLREALGRVRATASATNSTTGSSAGPFSPPSAISPPGAGIGGFGGNSAGGAAGVSSTGLVAGPFSPPHRTGTGAAALEPRTAREKAPTAIERTDALWADMQRTLQEVELSASRGTHFFGRGHPRALQELREAQIALAQAWARERDEDVHGDAQESAAKLRNRRDKDRTKDARDSDSARSPGASLSSDDLDETEADMAAARRRREASDRYFERVSRHVEEVTKRLEDVAVAMGKVEEESREGWSEEDGEQQEEDAALESASSSSDAESASPGYNKNKDSAAARGKT